MFQASPPQLNPGAFHRGLIGFHVPPKSDPMYRVFAVAGMFSVWRASTDGNQNRFVALPSIGYPDVLTAVNLAIYM